MIKSTRRIALLSLIGGILHSLDTLVVNKDFLFALVDIPQAEISNEVTDNSVNLRTSFGSSHTSTSLQQTESESTSRTEINPQILEKELATNTAVEESKSREHTNEETEQEKESKNSGNYLSVAEIMESTSSNSEIILVWNKDLYQSIQTLGSQFSMRDKVILVENEKGYINDKRQLVVNVNETYLFWYGGQQKLCSLLQNMTFASSLDDTTGIDIPSTVLNVTMDCVDYSKTKQGLGQGNWITAIYAARMASYLAGVDFRFQCLDGQSSRMSMLLPWFDKYQVADSMNRSFWPNGGVRPSAQEACPEKYPFLRIDKMAFEIQDDLRKMAVSLVGTRDEKRRHPDVPIDAAPMIPDVKLDDVALHFRCGDVLGGARRNDFGMIRFNEYKKWIPNTTESIGILTQPFDKDRNRGQDSQKVDNCRTVVYALVDYLQDFAPNARISIHNGLNESLPLTYARLVMANYSITSLSSFGIFPIIGTFGDGYFQKGNRGVNPFARYVPNILPNIHQMEADVRGTGEMMGKSVENLVDWFVDEAFVG
mmetsp:Transcript_25462/g.70123  ORF Transcript_25462/g.70123 Transcript_25462/m.70123 type:complete len:539 (+) Transcript_25462:123-1739(+)